MATSLNPPYPPHILPRVLVCLATVLSVAFFVFGWHRFVPLLGTWEYFHFFYAFGSIDPEVTFAIAPRANIGGQGYPLIDIGIRLTETIGLSLPSFRAISFIHALLTYVALITVFSRWFGLIPAAAGVTLTVLSTGYVFFANQVLVSFPTLLLCVLLISATQRLERSPGSTAVLLLISAICALLLVHYSMGRFFAVGWLIYLFATHILAAVTMFSRKDLVRRYVIRQAGLALTVMTATTFILLLLYAGNVRALMNPATIFFPSFGAEIEIKPSEILSTILQNTALIGEMLFPFVSFSGDGLATNFLDGHRAPLLDYWHAPLLALGVLVALRRSLRKDGPTSWPYLALHATAALTFGLALFSAHYDDIWTISPYRIFGGYIAIAGYMTVAFLWVHEAARTRVAPFKHAAVILAVVAVAASAASLTKQSDAILKSTEALAPINVVSGDFAPYPEVYSYGDYVIPRLQARYRTLARNLAP